MTKNSDYTTLLQKVIEMSKNEKHTEALSLIELMIKEHGEIPLLLVMKGVNIQLSSDDTYNLDDVRNSFEKALMYDEEYVDAILEMAWFEYAVEDNAGAANERFDKAIHILKKQFEEALSGKAKCILETASGKELKVFINNVFKSLENSEVIKSIMEEK